MDNMKITKLILKHALINALQHGGKARAKPVLNKLISENPQLKANIREIIEITNKIVEEVNSMEINSQKEKLKEFIDVENLDKYILSFRQKSSGYYKLPPLPEAVPGKVVLRLAPNPNGPLHLGSARMVLLNDYYAKRYNGTLILRFDDTDPKTPSKRPLPEAYEMIKEDLKWLEVIWHREEYASKRIPRYMEVFEKLISMGKAYICTCPPDKWRKLIRIEGKPCPCRGLPIEDQLERWDKMVKGEYGEREAVARIKTELSYPDPAVRDWAAFRIIYDPEHPIVGNKYHLWPLLDFASGIDDHDFGVTHIIRGKDLTKSKEKQIFIYNYFGWKYPITKLFGKIFFRELLSTSKMRKGIQEGKYWGWDDPRLLTLMALRKRGFTPEAIREFILSFGLKEIEVHVSLDTLIKINRKLLDPQVNRYFVVMNPVKVLIKNMPSKVLTAMIPNHPSRPDKGFRKLSVSEHVYIDKEDATNYHKKQVRLMYLFNILLEDLDRALYLGDNGRTSLPKIHWLPIEESIDVIIIFPSGERIRAIGEKSIIELREGTIFHAPRVGFFRVDSINKNTKTAILYYTHD